MPKVAYKDIDSFFKKYKKDLGNNAGRQTGTVFLIFGEESLYKAVLNRLKELLLPSAAGSLNFEPLEGTDINFPEIIERANTFSLLSAPKVVAALDAQVFDSRQNVSQMWENARTAFKDQKIHPAAKIVLRIMGLKGLSLADSIGDKSFRALALPDADGDDYQVWDDILTYCKNRNLRVPRAADSAGLLQRAIEKGLPAGNYLVVTCATVDKRRSLYKAFMKNGTIIDCSVPRSDRRADKQVQNALLQEKLKAALAVNAKTMTNDVFKVLVEMTGFELRAFDSNVQKLITFVGSRKSITRDDVNSVITRTKQDPVYAFTNAVTDRNLKDALFYLNTLMADGPGALRPEQMLVAVHNQMRKLLVIKDFLKSTLGNSWYTGCPFNLFQQNVLPLVKKYDRVLLDRLDHWQSVLSENETAKGAKKKKPKVTTDLLIASKGSNPYPIYLMLQKAERFSRQHLLNCIKFLSQADRRIKTGGADKKLILEELLIRICRQSVPASDADAYLSAVTGRPQK